VSVAGQLPSLPSGAGHPTLAAVSTMEILLIKGAKFVESNFKPHGMGGDLDAGEQMQHERVRPRCDAPLFGPCRSWSQEMAYATRLMLVRTRQVWKDAPVRVRRPARREQEPDISDTEEESDTDAHEADMIGATLVCACRMPTWAQIS
jgi:hypothetical protein